MTEGLAEDFRGIEVRSTLRSRIERQTVQIAVHRRLLKLLMSQPSAMQENAMGIAYCIEQIEEGADTIAHCAFVLSIVDTDEATFRNAGGRVRKLGAEGGAA
jgi:hypothetical protein